MLKMCSESINKPLDYIFRVSLNDERFPSERKKSNVVPIHKTDDKRILKITDRYRYSQSTPKSLKQ